MPSVPHTLCALLVLACAACSKPDGIASNAGAKVVAERPDPRVERGRELYTRICAVCHGARGEGYAADNAPALNHPAFLGSATDPFLYQAIAEGRTGSTMSAWSTSHGGPLDASGIQAVILFMRTWYQGAPRPLDERPLSGDRPRGARLYTQHCVRCHGATGIEGPYARVGDAALLGQASDGFLRLAIGEGRAPTPMEGFAKTLGPQGIDDVIVHLRARPRSRAAGPPRPATAKAPLPLPPLPLNPRGKPPVGFVKHPATTPMAVVARELKRGARMALLDARAPSDYLREHIAGAASVPYYDPTPYFDQLPKDVWLVSYCACPHAESKTLAQKLSEAGFAKVTVLDEGIGAWKSKGHPTEGANATPPGPSHGASRKPRPGKGAASPATRSP